VLVRMHTRIIPHMASPLLLADFLFRALDAGGLLGMLALHGIFTLVTKHGLEYPHFYPRLYCLLTPASFMVIRLFLLVYHPPVRTLPT
jgi:U3 small nucleolar RNA-associated protein 19